jgi:hypothetical protein
VFREGCCFLTDRPLETFELLQIDPWPGYIGNPISADQIPVRGLIGDEGQVGENIQGLTAVSGVAGVEAERGYGGVSTAKPSGRRRCSGGWGVGGQWRSS